MTTFHRIGLIALGALALTACATHDVNIASDFGRAIEFDQRAQERIAAFARLDLIGQAMANVIAEIERAMAAMAMAMP